MSLALYRKYRPGSFAEVFGQEHVTGPICQALSSGRIHHAYLFSGPRGCGKTSSARILARSLNCEQGPTPTPCGVCDSCVALAPMGPGSLDVIEIDAASHGLVDDARDLRDKAFYAPVSSRFKIYVIDEAHMITNAAFNALLKVVEEPPPHVKFIFATTEPDKVLVTIKSRTFHYRFRLIPPQVMRAHLAELCEAEGITIDPLVLPLIVRAGAGSARDAQSILDQLAAGSGDEGVTYDRALSLLGFTDAALQEEVVDAFADFDGAAVFRAVDRVIEAGLEPRRFVQDLLERFRDLLVLDAVPDAADTGLIDAPVDQLERMHSQAQRYGRPALSRAADVMATALVEMRGTTSPRLVLELACARILLPGAAGDSAALLVRLDRIERRISATTVVGSEAEIERAPEARQTGQTGRTSSPAAAPTAAPKSAPETAPKAAAPEAAPEAESSATPKAASPAPAPDVDVEPGVEPGAVAGPEPVAVPSPVIVLPDDEPYPTSPSRVGVLDVAALRRLWDDVLEAVKQRSRITHALMLSSQIESVDERALTLSFTTATLATRFAADDVSSVVRAALKQVVGAELIVRAIAGGAHSGGAAEPGTTSSASVVRASAAASDPEPDEIDLSTEPGEDTERAVQDPADSALALLKKGLGAQVIGEIDQS